MGTTEESLESVFEVDSPPRQRRAQNDNSRPVPGQGLYPYPLLSGGSITLTQTRVINPLQKCQGFFMKICPLLHEQITLDARSWRVRLRIER
jgi:hypothetical protein